MIDRGGRDRFRRDFSPRFEEKSHYGRDKAPPSRHLWVGNLSHRLTEAVLSEQFSRFGELESIAFQPGRSYAFVNFRKNDDAIIAIRELQDFVIAGLPLKIEFAKAEKSVASSHGGEYLQRRDEGRSVEHGTSLFQRDSRPRRNSPEPFHHDKSKMGNRSADPSEVLWIGFPSSLNIDEVILRQVFSPFGEIEKITAFPGRGYAFVQFRSVVAACKAKEALQGKLFNNPRVSICFSKSEIRPNEHGRNLMNAPSSPNFMSNGHQGRSSENFRIESPRFVANLGSGDAGIIAFNRNYGAGGSGSSERKGFQRLGSERGFSEEIFEGRRTSPARDRVAFQHDLSPDRLKRKSSHYDGPRDLPDDVFPFREAKKLNMGPLLPDKDLPEYPFSESLQEKQEIGLPKIFPDLSGHGAGPFGYKQFPDRLMSFHPPYGDREDLKASHGSFDAGSGSWPTNPLKGKSFTPEPHNEEWKWEGTIAKGGTPVCRVRCFPVGKVMDIMLPNFLNCTARTGLDMLAKHFYQAASTWVVFFVPQSDSDISFYNEFLHYLGEKQRAAVAKLGEKTTLFLVPPSEFSEKVLKVPGKMSISGVILRFQQNPNFGSVPHPLEAIDTKPPFFNEDITYPKPTSPDPRSSQRQINSSEPFPSINFLSPFSKPGEDLPYLGNPSLSAASSFPVPTYSLPENRFEPPPPQHRNPNLPSNWSPQLRNSNLNTGNLPSQVFNNASIQTSENAIPHNFPPIKPRPMQEMNSSNYAPAFSSIPPSGNGKFSQQETKAPPASTFTPVPSFQPEQLAQLASLLGQQQQKSGNLPILSSTGEDNKQSSHMNHPDHTFMPPFNPMTQNHTTEASTSHFNQVHQFQPHTSGVEIQQQTVGPEFQANQDNGGQEETEGDPQKRLQATLQLAAALLQQIQQQAKTVDQR